MPFWKSFSFKRYIKNNYIFGKKNNLYEINGGDIVMEREYTPIVDFFKYSTRPLFLRIFKLECILLHNAIPSAKVFLLDILYNFLF
jgi:hypothetical protein